MIASKTVDRKSQMVNTGKYYNTRHYTCRERGQSACTKESPATPKPNERFYFQTLQLRQIRIPANPYAHACTETGSR
jgi:hypothetical protein